ncbi:four helix bundle protein [Nostoc sp.]|uniref:four helix bundle protein n=2 Tax=unclassified Nostoc TaxID=2593658 RepID=UPI002FFC5BAE
MGKGEGGKGKGERGREGMERKKIETFEDLKVWQKGIDLVKQIYLRTKEGELSKDFGLRDQLRRATVSIPTNIAEGFERYSRKEYLNFLNIAKGSAGEVRSLLRVALEVGYLDQPTYTQLSNQAIELSRMLSNQIQSINQSMPFGQGKG